MVDSHQDDMFDTEKVIFEDLVNKLRNSTISFNWVEIARHNIHRREYQTWVVQVVDHTLNPYNDSICVIVRVCPLDTNGNEIVDDSCVSFHLYLVRRPNTWEEIATSRGLRALRAWDIETMIYSIEDNNGLENIFQMIEELVDENTEEMRIYEWLEKLALIDV